MSTKEENIEKIMKFGHDQILREILNQLDDHKVSWIRQRLQPKWQDGFWMRMFDQWYADDDRASHAAKYFRCNGTKIKHYPEQGWAPEDEGKVYLYTCVFCETEVDSDDLFINHFRYGKCTPINELMESSIDEKTFLKGMDTKAGINMGVYQ